MSSNSKFGGALHPIAAALAIAIAGTAPGMLHAQGEEKSKPWWHLWKLGQSDGDVAFELREQAPGNNTESMLLKPPARKWLQDPAQFVEAQEPDALEQPEAENTQAALSPSQAMQLNRVKICRQETVCRLHYTAGTEQRARLRNLVTPLRWGAGQTQLPEGFVRRIVEARANLADKSNLVMHFVGHSAELPGIENSEQLLQQSSAEARRVALAVRDALNLPSEAVTSSGKGTSQPVAGNDTSKGRSLNQRVEVEFWYDDPMESAGDGVLACPESAAAETITIAHESPTGPLPSIRFVNGAPELTQSQLAHIRNVMAEVESKANVRLGFVGYTDNKGLERREAMVYGDDLGLSRSRAQRAMALVQQGLGLTDSQVEFEGRGHVQSDNVVADGFLGSGEARVEVQVLYDELAILAEQDRIEIERIEQEAQVNNPFALNLMRITVDGSPEYDPYRNSADLQRCTDVALDEANIQFRFDNQDAQPRLNVTAWPETIRYADDLETDIDESKVRFKSYSNYPAFIDRSEIRLFEDGLSTRSTPLAIIPLDANGEGEWNADLQVFQAPMKKLQFLLRAYDKENRFDETSPQSLWLVDRLDSAPVESEAENKLLAGYGESRLARQTIPLGGSSVLVNGQQVPDGHTVWLGGNPVPVGENGAFAGEQILDKGLHTVEVAVLDAEGNGELFLRDVRFRRNDWFSVGIADLTISADDTNGPAALVTGDASSYDNSVHYDGRLAFYTSGSFGDGWRLSASADTQEGPVDELFSSFLEKSPDALFRRLDADLYYPTFGDDSTVVEDAPTSGKFYTKLSRYDDYGLWGNFKASHMDNELAQIDRALYGASGHFETDAVTDFGEKRFEIDGFAAEPGTIAGREEFRGTGGSLYFLRQQDLLVGSERLRVEVRDKDSGLVLGVRNLTPVIDYDVDYIQGRVILNRPLSAIANDNLLVQSGSYNGHPQFLVARYEYTPGFEDMDALAVGGRAHYWFGDHVKIGLSGTRQDAGELESKLHGVDLTLRKSAGSWLKIETASSEGGNLQSVSSYDGGFSFEQQAPLADPGARADASRIEGTVQLQDFFEGARGSGTFYHQEREAGFSAPGQLVQGETIQSGASVSVPIGTRLDVNLKADSSKRELGLETESVDLSVGYRVSERWKVTTGTRTDSREDLSPVVAPTQTQGERTDMAVRASYDSGEDWRAFGFVQQTLDASGTREENNRYGVGSAYRVNDRLTLDSELSEGDTGTGAQLGADFRVSDRTNLYLNYALDNERSDTGVQARRGNMSSGFRSRYSDSLNIYGEERYSHGDVATGLTHALGVDLSPGEHWSYGSTFEAGTLEDPRTGAETERRAVGLSVGRSGESMRLSSALEYRTDVMEQSTDEALPNQERETWLLKNSLSYQVDENWRLVAKLNYSDSKSSLGQFYGGEFTEGVLGYAYRPVDNDRLNALVKYTYFYNLPTPGQVTLKNTAAEFIQKSHIFAVDANYDISERWTLGAKYAHRLGQLSMEREDPEFFDSRANLYVLRADWHLVHRWDLLIEGRLLDLPDAGDRRSGALLGIYRHVGDHLKLGVGYNFTDFSDDLTQLDYDHQGVFLNVIGKL
ncbi:flagellar motor protein MotB [Biformimicrobium ophioploci]|uniref:Flagellar motor protein MotB n=1 Tax=Biformimicrobium ophioploci TaxID=3036711 RepID=A0ABQ6LWG4_9GAMM|nr:flagellar motor protein MotB [Microbulbifer sp. NKW57]GMG86401.1 hypothetical protein MNKW57_07220 [Microbulbifer sp. NKW57]